MWKTILLCAVCTLPVLVVYALYGEGEWLVYLARPWPRLPSWSRSWRSCWLSYPMHRHQRSRAAGTGKR